MKQITDVLGLLLTLFILGAITYGSLKEGYAMQVVLIFAVIGFFIYLYIRKEELDEKRVKEKIEKEKLQKFHEEVKSIKEQMYLFAYNNDKITKLIYDIEEGGDYLTQFEEYGIKQIDRIVNSIILYPDEDIQKHIPKIKDEILKLAKVKTKNRYVGF